MQAVAILRARVPAARLVIIGEGEERGAVESAIRRHGAADAVQLLGYRPDARRLLPALDVFANSSISEGISLTILEAMAAALPVVATRVGGTPEVVVPGSTGLLVEARAPGAMADALSQLAHSRERGEAWGRAGRQRLESSFTLDCMIAGYAREYARVCAQRG